MREGYSLLRNEEEIYWKGASQLLKNPPVNSDVVVNSIANTDTLKLVLYDTSHR